MGQVHLRNIETGAIKVCETVSDEFANLRAERTKSGRFPLWEQTGAHDADPENHATKEEAQARSSFGVPASDVTADGIGKSEATEAVLSKSRVAPEEDETLKTKAKA
jgi:hypothetical protein